MEDLFQVRVALSILHPQSPRVTLAAIFMNVDCSIEDGILRSKETRPSVKARFARRSERSKFQVFVTLDF